MTDIEKQLNAIIRYLAAEKEEDRELAKEDLRRMLGKRAKPAGFSDTEQIICDILLDIGVPEHIVGHRYLVFAIHMVVQDQKAINAIMRELYSGGAQASQVRICV